MRMSHTAALLTAAVGVPYTATETEIGKSAVGAIQAQTASVASAIGITGDHANTHRQVEEILIDGVERYRYNSTPMVLAKQVGVGVIDPKSGDPRYWANAKAGQTLVSGASGVGVGGGGSTMGESASTGPQTPLPPQGGPAVIQSSMKSASDSETSTPAKGVADKTQSGSTLIDTLVGGPIHDLREVLRFDITPEWVTGHFARVSTVLADTHLEGFRVPIVTGIGTADLAGTLTYYFDYSGGLQRVMMHAITGDVSRVIEAMTTHYGLAVEPTLEAGVYTRRWNAQPVHFLRVSRAPVVYRDALHHKFTVFIELNQPNLRYGISEEARQIIMTDRSTGRW